MSICNKIVISINYVEAERQARSTLDRDFRFQARWVRHYTSTMPLTTLDDAKVAGDAKHVIDPLAQRCETVAI